jgi:hypothetical protein
MKFEKTAEIFPESWEQFKYFIRALSLFEIIEHTIYGPFAKDTAGDYEICGLLEDFFDNKGIYLSTLPTCEGDLNKGVKWFSEIRSKKIYAFMPYIQTLHQVSRQDAFEVGIFKCFEILEKYLKENPNG